MVRSEKMSLQAVLARSKERIPEAPEEEVKSCRAEAEGHPAVRSLPKSI